MENALLASQYYQLTNYLLNKLYANTTYRLRHCRYYRY